MRFFILGLSWVLHYFYLSLDFFSYVLHIVTTKINRRLCFLYFYQPFWYTEFIVGFNFLCFSFFFAICFSFFFCSVFYLITRVIILFFMWLGTGSFLLYKRKFLNKNKLLLFLFLRVFSFLNYWFDYHHGKFFCFLCELVFWYFRAMNVPFSFLLKVRFSYERICIYILFSLCSIISIFAFVPSFISENL